MNIQSWVGCRLCFGTRGCILCKSPDFEMVQDAGGGCNTGRKENGGVGGNTRYWRCGGIYILEFLQCDSYPECCWVMNTKRPSHHLAQRPST